MGMKQNPKRPQAEGRPRSAAQQPRSGLCGPAHLCGEAAPHAAAGAPRELWVLRPGIGHALSLWLGTRG